jgi:hypothetical protein
MYKVLDVREYDKVVQAKYYHSTQAGLVEVIQRHFVVAICEDIHTKERKRFEFFEGYQSKGIGSYLGYQGDFNYITRGDYIEVVDTDTYPEVKIVNVSVDQ